MLGAGGRCWGQRYPRRGVALMGAGGAPGAGRDLPPATCSPCQEVQPPQCCSDAALLGSAGPACPVGTPVRVGEEPLGPPERTRRAPFAPAGPTGCNRRASPPQPPRERSREIGCC